MDSRIKQMAVFGDIEMKSGETFFRIVMSYNQPNKTVQAMVKTAAIKN